MLIAVTASATPSRGYSYDEANEMLDLFGAVLDGRATEKTALRMLEIVGNAQPISASARKSMKVVRVDADKVRDGLAGVTDSFWKRYRAKHPQPAQKRRPVISTLRGRSR